MPLLNRAELYVVDLATRHDRTCRRWARRRRTKRLDRQQSDAHRRRLDGWVRIAGVQPVFGDANGFSDAFTTTLQVPGGTAASPGRFNSVQSGFSLTGDRLPRTRPQRQAGSGRRSDPARRDARGRQADSPGAGDDHDEGGKKTRKKKAVLANLGSSTHAEGTATLVLHLASKYAKDLKSAGKLEALVTVNYTPRAPGEAFGRSERNFASSRASKEGEEGLESEAQSEVRLRSVPAPSASSWSQVAISPRLGAIARRSHV